MKMKKTENYKLMDKVLNAFSEKGDILCAFYVIGDGGGVCGTGDAKILSRLFYEALRNGLTKGSDENQKNISSAIITAVALMLEENSKQGEVFRKLLDIDYEEDEDDEDDGSICEGCAELKTCMEEEAIAYRKAHHIPKPKDKKSKKSYKK